LNQRGKTKVETVGLNLTVAQYLTPNGTNIHGIGIAPNYLIATTTDQTTTHQSVTTHSQHLLKQGNPEAAWLWMDKPLQTACKLLAPYS
jgi:C-terminal processing protease CtpA/Prc